jgi:hypothetical protein
MDYARRPTPGQNTLSNQENKRAVGDGAGLHHRAQAYRECVKNAASLATARRT